MHRRLRSLFVSALEVPAEKRIAFLARMCPDDPEICRRAARLLSAHGWEGDLLDAGSTADLPPADLPSEIGPYRIQDLLGWGGMGVVYLARDTRRPPDAAPVALKLLRGSALASKANLRRRIAREGDVLGRLHHPGIARLEETGTLILDGSDVPYVATEYVDGLDLREYAAASTMTTPDKLRLLRDLALALDYAHARGVIHRDLKPENILVTSDGSPHILDFGVARLVDPETEATDPALTRVGQLVGTPQYMSPEQAAAGHPVDGRSDVYSLGVIGYELLSGRLPYDVSDESLHRAVVAVLTAEARPLSEVDATLGGAVESVIHCALAREPAARYESAERFANDLDRCLVGKRVAAGPLRARSGEVRRWVTGIALVALVAVVSIVSWQLRGREPSASRAPDPTLILDIDRAQKLLHAGRTHSQSDVAQAITLLEDLRDRIAATRRAPYSGYLDMFVEFRLGEAYYFQGTMDNDVKALARARDAWTRSMRAFGTVDSLELLTVARPIFSDLSRLGRHHPLSGRAAAALALADLERPHVHTSTARKEYSDARTLLGSTDPPNYHPVFGPRPDVRLLDSCIVWNGLGESLMRDGEVGGDADLLSEAITVFHECGTLWIGRVDREPFASFRYNFGTAYRIRASLTHSLADLDSSRTQIHKAMALTSAAERPDLHADYRLELALVATVTAELTEDPSETLRQLEEANEMLARARSLIDAADAPVLVARIDVQSVDVLVRMAEADPSRGFGPADSLLRVSAPALASSHRPLLRAQWHLARSRLLRVRWQATKEEALRTESLDALSRARELTTENDSPAFFRETRREWDLLGG